MSLPESFESTESLIKILKGPHPIDQKLEVGYKILNSTQHDIPRKVPYLIDWISNLLIRSHDKKARDKSSHDDKNAPVVKVTALSNTDTWIFLNVLLDQYNDVDVCPIHTRILVSLGDAFKQALQFEHGPLFTELQRLVQHLFITLKTSFRPTLEEFSQFVKNWCHLWVQTDFATYEAIWTNTILPLTTSIMNYFASILKQQQNYKKLFTSFLDSMFLPILKLRSLILNNSKIVLKELDMCIRIALFHDNHYQEYTQGVTQFVQSQLASQDGAKRRKTDDHESSYMVPLPSISDNSHRYPLKLILKLEQLKDSEFALVCDNLSFILEEYIHMVHTHYLQLSEYEQSKAGSDQHSIYCFYMLLRNLCTQFDKVCAIQSNSALLKVLYIGSNYRKNDDTSNMDHFNALLALANTLQHLLENKKNLSVDFVDSIMYNIITLIQIDYTLLEDRIPWLLEFIFIHYNFDKKDQLESLNECLAIIITTYVKLRKLDAFLTTLFDIMKRFVIKSYTFPSFWKAYTQLMDQLPVGQIEKIFQLLLDQLEIFITKMIQKEGGMPSLTEVEDETPLELYKDNFIVLSLLFTNYLCSIKLNPVVAYSLVEYKIPSAYNLVDMILENRLSTEILEKSRRPISWYLQGVLLVYIGLNQLESHIYTHFISSDTYFKQRPYLAVKDDPKLNLDIIMGIHESKKMTWSLRALLHKMSIQRLTQLYYDKAYQQTDPSTFFNNNKDRIHDDTESIRILSFLEKEMDRMHHYLYQKNPSTLPSDPCTIILYDEKAIYTTLWEMICNNVAVFAHLSAEFSKKFLALWIQSLSDVHLYSLKESSQKLLLDASFYELDALKVHLLNHVLENVFQEWKSKNASNPDAITKSIYNYMKKGICGEVSKKESLKLLKKVKPRQQDMDMDIEDSDDLIHSFYLEFIEGLPAGYMDESEMDRFFSLLYGLYLSSVQSQSFNMASLLLRTLSRLLDCSHAIWISPEIMCWIIDHQELDENTDLLLRTYLRRLLSADDLSTYSQIFQHIKSSFQGDDVLPWLYILFQAINIQYKAVQDSERFKKKKRKRTELLSPAHLETISPILHDIEHIWNIDIWDLSCEGLDLDFRMEMLHFVWNTSPQIPDERVTYLSNWCLDHAFDARFDSFYSSFLLGLSKEQTQSLLEKIHDRIASSFKSNNYMDVYNHIKLMKKTLEWIQPSIRYQVIGSFCGQFISTLAIVKSSWENYMHHEVYYEEINLYTIYIFTFLVQDKFAFLSSRHIATILGCLIPMDRKTLSSSMFLAYYHLLSALIKVRPYQSIHNIVPFYMTLKYLLHQIFTNNQMPILCTHHISRLYMDLSQTKSVPKLFGYYIVVDFIEILEKETVHMEIRDALYPGIFSFLNHFNDVQTKVVMKHLNEVGKNMFKQMYEIYTRDFKFDGKV